MNCLPRHKSKEKKMRCTQIQGLTDAANEFLLQNGKKVVIARCPHCNGILTEATESNVCEDASDVGMFDDGPILHEYTLQNGTTVKEVIQTTVWSSGPCIFLCLEDQQGKQLFPWRQEVIDKV
jgi:hypothetical protein